MRRSSGASETRIGLASAKPLVIMRCEPTPLSTAIAQLSARDTWYPGSVTCSREPMSNVRVSNSAADRAGQSWREVIMGRITVDDFIPHLQTIVRYREMHAYPTVAGTVSHARSGRAAEASKAD